MEGILRFQVRPRLREPDLVLAFEGWNDAAQAATLAARHLSASIGSVALAEIDAEDFYDFTVERPRIRVEGGRSHGVEWPHTEFRFGTVGPEKEIAIGVGAEPHLRWRRYGDAVLELARELGVRRVVLLGAFLADVLYSRPVSVSGTATSPERLRAIGVEETSYQGPTGIVGVLAERLREAGFEVASLWAGLPHYIHLSPNPRGALALLQKLALLLDLRLDLHPLEEAAAEFEEKVSALVAGDPELAEYVRQLKRREFAQ